MVFDLAVDLWNGVRHQLVVLLSLAAVAGAGILLMFPQLLGFSDVPHVGAVHDFQCGKRWIVNVLWSTGLSNYTSSNSSRRTNCNRFILGIVSPIKQSHSFLVPRRTRKPALPQQKTRHTDFPNTIQPSCKLSSRLRRSPNSHAPRRKVRIRGIPMQVDDSAANSDPYRGSHVECIGEGMIHKPCIPSILSESLGN